MNGLDIVILVAFFGSTLIGAMRGFTKEILSLFSWGGSLALSYIFLPIAQEFMHHYIANPIMAGGAGFFCVFIISLVILSIIANIIAGYIHESSFRGVDHSLGFGFGILRGVVFISAVELGVSTFWPRQNQPLTIQSARFVPMARKGGDTLLQVLPASARSWILEQAAKVESQVNSKVREHLKATAPHVLFGGSPGEGQGSVNEGGALSPHHSFAGGQPSQAPAPNMPMQHSPQVMVQSQQGGQAQSQMVVIRPPQLGQAPELAPASESLPFMGNPSGGMPLSSQPAGIGQSALTQDTQSTVDELARLKPQSSSKEESGYTRGQRDDMNRLFQAADGG